MTQQELTLHENQLKEIDAARASISKLRQKAERCGRMGLTVLAAEYDHYAKCLEERIPLQAKVLKGDLPKGFQ